MVVANKLVNQKDKEKSRLSKDEWREFTKTVWHIANIKHPQHPAVFPEEIPLRLIKLFSFYGDTVLDPFAGIGTTAQMAISLGRNAICVEQNPLYIRIIKTRKPTKATRLIVKRADSRDLSFIPDNSIDLIVTSPPYWNKANYGNRKDNLGKIDRYDTFLKEIQKVFKECYRVLFPGRKICVVTANVNQHTEYGLLTFPLVTDFTNLLRGLGFLMTTEIVWSKDGTGGKWGSWGHQRPIFGSYPYPPNFLFKNIHEYILIFAKPNSGKTRGPKVRFLREIMGEKLSP